VIGFNLALLAFAAAGSAALACYGAACAARWALQLWLQGGAS